MYPLRWLMACGLAGFLAGLAVFMPARVAVSLVPWSRLQVSPPQQVEGTLWEGAAQLNWRDRYAVHWSLSGWALLALRVQADVRLEGRELDGEGQVRFSPYGRSVRIDKASVGPSRLLGLLPASGVRLDQPLLVRGLELGLGGGVVRSASGALAWGPGEVRLRDGSSLAVPALRGIVTLAADGRPRVDVDSEREPGHPVAELDVSPALTELHLTVRQRALVLAGQPGAQPRSPDDVAFEVRQPLR